MKYAAGHPWYYLLGGKILSPKEILAAVKEKNIKGYMEDEIETINRKHEPQRSEALRALEKKIIADYRQNLSRYLELARALRRRRREGLEASNPSQCEDIHVNISLKQSHLINNLAHLHQIHELLTYQLDLFA